MTLEPGTSLGSYRVESLLGRGGMGAVFPPARITEVTWQEPAATP